MNSMLEITGKEINALNDTDLRSLVGLLCEAELRSQNIRTAGITFGGHQDAQDGGLDVRVQVSDILPGGGFIPKPHTGFQVKKPDMPRSKILEEMRPNNELRQVICELANLSGAYIIISSTGSTSDSVLSNRRAAMREALSNIDNAPQLTTDFYDRERLAAWVRSHPSLTLWVRNKIGMPMPGWRPFGNWANPSGGITEEYLLDGEVRLYKGASNSLSEMPPLEGINCLRKALHQPRSSVRLIGLSGVGKTRLLQALFDNRIGEKPLDPSQVFYADMGISPNPNPRHFAEHLIALKNPAILAVDNCSPELHRHLTSVCIAPGSLVSLITIEYDIREDQPEETDVFRLDPASIPLMEKLVQRRFPNLTQIDARTIAGFSGGNSRIAIALAATVSIGESLVNLKDEELFKRLFEQRNAPNTTLLKSAEVCSLVYSFEGEKTDEISELSLLGSLADMTAKELFSDVAELKRRSLVQQRNIWKAVLPHAIANKLAQRALENFPLEAILKVFEGGSERLLQSFSRRLSYLHENPIAIKIATQWLSRGGLLEDIRRLNDLEAKLLTNIAPIAPDLVVKAFEDAVNQEGPSLFCRANPHLNKLAQILRSIAYDQKMFPRCATLLCHFALTHHSEGHHQFSKELLKSLFSIRLSGTHATANQRLQIIEDLVNSQEEEAQGLGLELLSVALEAWHFSTHYNFDFGGHSRDYGYWPENQEEWHQWFSLFINFTMALALSELPISMKAKILLSEKFRGLWVKAGMFNLLEEVVKAIAARGNWNEGWVAISNTINFDTSKMDSQLVARLIILKNLLAPSNLLERGQACLLTTYGPLPDFNDSGEAKNQPPSARFKQNEIVAKQIGREVAENPLVFNRLLPEMFKAKGNRPFYFAQGLAEGCNDHQEMWEQLRNQYSLLSTGERFDTIFGGFLSGTSKKNPTMGEEILDKAVTDDILAPIYPWLQTEVDIKEQGVQRLKQSLQYGIAPISNYLNIGLGRVHESINNENFCDLLRTIKSKPDGLWVAIEIFDMRLHGDFGEKNLEDPLIISLGQELLTQLQFNHVNSKMDSMDYKLGLIVDACLEGENASAIGSSFCNKLAKAIGEGKLYPMDYTEVLGKLAKKQPITFLDSFISNNFTDESKIERVFSFDEGLKSNPFSKIDDRVILDWCADDPNIRYQSIASVLPSCWKRDGQGQFEWTSLALALIGNSPDPIPVLDALKNSLRPMTWSGSRAKIMEERLNLLTGLKLHSSQLVSEWANKEEMNFQDEIALERQRENPHNRLRDETFE